MPAFIRKKRLGGKKIHEFVIDSSTFHQFHRKEKSKHTVWVLLNIFVFFFYILFWVRFDF